MAFDTLAKLFSEPQHLTSKEGEADQDAGLTMIDYEEQTAGYQAAYSRLAASETVEADPVAFVRDPREYLGQQLKQLQKSKPQIKSLLTAVDPSSLPFVQSLVAAGYIA